MLFCPLDKVSIVRSHLKYHFLVAWDPYYTRPLPHCGPFFRGYWLGCNAAVDCGSLDTVLLTYT